LLEDQSATLTGRIITRRQLVTGNRVDEIICAVKVYRIILTELCNSRDNCPRRGW